MPNYVRSVVTVYGNYDSLARLVNLVSGENGAFDFDKIIPMPESLNLPEGSVTNEAIWYYCKKNDLDMPSIIFVPTYLNDDFEKKITPEKAEEFLKMGKQYLENIDKYGTTSWYGWRCDNWGTKWNAMMVYAGEIEKINEGKYSVEWRFDTAWDAPNPVFDVLFKKFPELEFEITSVDEDLTATILKAKNGESDSEYFDNDEGREIAMSIWD